MKNALPLSLATLVAMAALGYSMYNKPHKDYAQEEAVQTWTADELVQEFKANPSEMQSKWQEHVVAVVGKVASSSGKTVILAPGVVANYDLGNEPDIEPSGVVKVKGRLVGFDDLFGEVRLDHAQLID